MKKAVIIAVAIAFCGTMLPISVARYKAYERTVDVKGLCETEVMADRVIWPMSYKIAGDELSVVLAKMDRQNAAIIKFLKDGGLSDSEITVSVPEISDKFASEYNNDRAARYVLGGVINVCSDNVSAVLELQSKVADLMKSGVVLNGYSWENKPQYQFVSLNEIKPEMIEKANRNAREAADKFASDSGSSIGKIKSATQGTFSIEDRDSNTPYMKKVRVVTYVTYYLKN